MNDVLTIIFAAAPGLLAAGGLFVKVQNLESAMKERVTREVFDLRLAHVSDQLAEIKVLLRSLVERE